MARSLRIEYAGALYLVMARGNQGHSFGKKSKSVGFLGLLTPFTRVSQAVSRVEQKPQRKLKELKNRLLELEKTDV